LTSFLLSYIVVYESFEEVLVYWSFGVRVFATPRNEQKRFCSQNIWNG